MAFENLTSRISRIISGNAHAIINAAENLNPDAIMEQTIREIDSAIVEVRTEHGKKMIEIRNIEKSIKAGNEEHSTLLEQIETAVREEKDDLAEAGISRQMDLEAQRTVLEESVLEIKTEIKKLEGYLSALLAKKRGMTEAYEQKKQTQKEFQNDIQNNQKVSHAEEAFNRIIGDEPLDNDFKDTDKLEELAELNRQNRIKARLEGLKNIVKHNG